MQRQTITTIAAALTACCALVGCSGAQTPALTSASLGSTKFQLNATQKQLVDKGVRQMTKDGNAVQIVSMDAARGKNTQNTDVCGYVRFKATNGKSTEQRYFVRLGPENGTEAALMGQVSNNPANTAKVKFMCSQAGLL